METVDICLYEAVIKELEYTKELAEHRLQLINKLGKKLTESYWISVRDKIPHGWCNLILVHVTDVFAYGETVKKYEEVTYAFGLLSSCGDWYVPQYDMKEWEVVAFHEVEHESVEYLIDKVRK